MKQIIDKKIWISEYSRVLLYGVLILSVLLSFIFSLKIETATLLSFEQTIFVIISAILFVFNESIISYSTISKIRNKINDLKKKNVKNDILSYIGNQSAIKQYDDFLNDVEMDIVRFSKTIETFKRKSYKLYMFFSLFGFIVIIITIVKSNSVILTFLQGNDWIGYGTMLALKVIAVKFFVFGQLLSIPVWIISAYQTQLQKHEMLKYFEIKNISEKLEFYIKEKQEKNIDLQVRL
ncbi:hypothetical protein MLC35_01030 [Sulfurimonas sp. NW7]|uniref:hypothetical protein n=1 Tax=Sulfurimonas sp. NW7 TaxID=2922727 RepID=UPI003DA98CDB